MLDFVVQYAPKWSLWPDAVTDAITYFAGTLGTLNIIFPVDTFFSCLIFLIIFDASALTVVLIIRLIPFQKIV
jgi:hypothetical protein